MAQAKGYVTVKFHRPTRRQHCILCCIVVLAGLIPGVSVAQRSDDRAQFDARISVLQRSLADLSNQIEQLKVRDQQLQQQVEKMRTNFDQRLERLQSGGGSRTPTPHRRKP